MEHRKCGLIKRRLGRIGICAEFTGNEFIRSQAMTIIGVMACVGRCHNLKARYIG